MSVQELILGLNTTLGPRKKCHALSIIVRTKHRTAPEKPPKMEGDPPARWVTTPLPRIP